VQEIEKFLQHFVSQWDTHGTPLAASFLVPHKHFIVMAADESATQASGCSIDKSVAVIRTIEQQFSVQLLNRSKVAYLQNETVQLLNVADIKQSVANGIISENTLIFNNLVPTLGLWRSEWLVPASQTWTKRFFSESYA
jgi:hypothetical protein